MPLRWMHLSLFAALLMGSCLSVAAQMTESAESLPVLVLAQSPAETKTELQIICLFKASADNALHGSLLETDTKLQGLLSKIWKPNLFRGELGETILLEVPGGTLNAKRLLIVGLGDSATLTPDRMYLVGKIALREAIRLGIAHPFFAPTIRDGGVGKFTTGEVAEQVVRGFRDALDTEKVLRDRKAAGTLVVADVTYLAGQKFAADTQSGIDRALGRSTALRH